MIPSLRTALQDKDLLVRLFAAEALGEIGDPRALPALRKAESEDKTPSVRSVASEAIKRIQDAERAKDGGTKSLEARVVLNELTPYIVTLSYYP